MKRAKFVFVFLLSVLVIGAAPGAAKFGITKTRARFMMRHPPAFHTPGREIRMEVTSIDRRGGMAAPRLQQLLGQALIRENFKLTPTAAAILQGALNEVAASVDRQARSESVNVHVGEHTEYGKDGKAKKVEDCKYQTSTVTYLVSSGRAALNVTATDAKTQTVLLTQLLPRNYREESAVDGPQQCSGGTYNLSASQLQDPQVILNRLTEQLVTEAVKLVAGYDEPREVLLAVDDELKPGNAPALGGNWQAALDAWTNASVPAKKKDTEAARRYNLGVAREALAAAAMRNEALEEATAHLNEAEKLYSEALQLDPGEKYFRDTLTRLQNDRQVLQKEQEHQMLKQAEMAPPPEAAPATVTVNIPLAGWPENEPEAVHDFRAYVRMRVAGQKEEPNEALEKTLLARAAGYGVKEGTALQVVDSEVKRFLLLRQNLNEYRELFQEAAADGVVTAEERAVLQKSQKTLHLSQSQLKEVEAQFNFKAEPAVSVPTSTGKGLTLAEIQGLLQSSVPTRRVTQLVGERGIAFEVTPEVERKFRAAGADDTLMQALKEARR